MLPLARCCWYYAMLHFLLLFVFVGVVMVTLLSAPSPALQLPAGSLGGAWSVCYLRLLGSGWCELAGVPFSAASATVERLQSMGATRVSVASASSALCVVRFQAQRSIVLELSGSFPSASKVS